MSWHISKQTSKKQEYDKRKFLHHDSSILDLYVYTQNCVALKSYYPSHVGCLTVWYNEFEWSFLYFMSDFFFSTVLKKSTAQVNIEMWLATFNNIAIACLKRLHKNMFTTKYRKFKSLFQYWTPSCNANNWYYYSVNHADELQ